MPVRPMIFVGTVGEGVFRSDDEGQTFVRRSSGMNVECDVRALVVHPLDPRTLYAGTNEGLYRSSDAGEHWGRLDSPMNSLVIWSLCIDPRRPDSILAGTRPAHLFRSSDAGRSWSQLGATINQLCNNLVYNRVTTLLADPEDADGFWAGIEIDGVRRSSDRGESWSRLDSGLSSCDIHSMLIVPSSDGVRRILATTNNDLNVSIDEGRTWQPQRLCPHSSTASPALDQRSSGATEQFAWRYFRGMAQKPDDPRVVFLGNGDGPPGSVGALWRSADGGVTWRKADLPCVPNSTIWSFATHPADPNRIYAHSVSGELYGSLDGGSRWEKLPREFGEIRCLLWTSAA